MTQPELTWHERLLFDLHIKKRSNPIDQIFPEIYQQIYSVADGVRDYKQALDAKNASTQRKAAFFFNKDRNTFTLQVFDLSAKTSLSELMPILQNLDLYVLSESDFKIKLDNDFIFLHNFECQLPADFNSNDGNRLCEGFLTIWNGDCENDPLNALIFKSTLTAHDVTILRGIVRAMRQMQLSVSIDYMATILLMYPLIARSVIDYFKIRFDPSIKIDRNNQLNACEKKLNNSFQRLFEATMIESYGSC